MCNSIGSAALRIANPKSDAVNSTLRRQVDEQLDRVLAELPQTVHDLIESVPLHVEDYPSARVMAEMGAEILLVTNAAGCMNPEYQLADIVIIEDHINLMPDNPLRGVNDERLGPRFPDMSAPYDKELISIAEQSANELAIPCQKGVFVAVAGPNLETRAEYRMLRGMGADLVGMSTVPEVIVAVHAGLRVLAFSIATDICLPNTLEPVEIEKILQVAAQGGERLARLIPRVLEQLSY